MRHDTAKQTRSIQSPTIRAWCRIPPTSSISGSSLLLHLQLPFTHPLPTSISRQCDVLLAGGPAAVIGDTSWAGGCLCPGHPLVGSITHLLGQQAKKLLQECSASAYRLIGIIDAHFTSNSGHLKTFASSAAAVCSQESSHLLSCTTSPVGLSSWCPSPRGDRDTASLQCPTDGLHVSCEPTSQYQQ